MPPGACTPPSVGDAETAACIEKALAKCVLKSEKKCPDPPECLGDLFFVRVGPLNVIQGFDPLLFCGA